MELTKEQKQKIIELRSKGYESWEIAKELEIAEVDVVKIVSSEY